MDTTPACRDTQSCPWIVARACSRCVRSRSTAHSIEPSRSARAGQTHACDEASGLRTICTYTWSYGSHVTLAWVGIVPLMLLPLTYNEGNEHPSVFWCVYPD